MSRMTLRLIVARLFFASALFHAVATFHPIGVAEPWWEHVIFVIVNFGFALVFNPPVARGELDLFEAARGVVDKAVMVFVVQQCLEHSVRLGLGEDVVQNTGAIFFALMMPLVMMRLRGNEDHG